MNNAAAAVSNEGFMKLLQLFFKRETAAPMLALAFASAVSVTLVTARIISTRNLHYALLIYNLFLAWLPLIFALLASECSRKCIKPNGRFLALAGVWLLFFPNAPYIFTDLVHLSTWFYGHFWVDLALVLMCALTGLVLGFLSLYLMHSIVTKMYGPFTGWAFIAVAASLGSFGIYLGRFLRFNSWDVFSKPAQLYHGLGTWAGNYMYHPFSIAFLVLFAAFLFVAYLMLYALTHLSPAAQAVSAETAGELAAP
jgi:uncharacterized membrane protein